LIALIAASLLWYGLAAKRSEDSSVRRYAARLTLVNMPGDLVLTSSYPDSVSLQLSGPLTRTLDSSNPPVVDLDLSTARPGSTSFPINDSDVLLANGRPLPAEIVVLRVDPPGITLELERQESRLVPIRPVIEGVPAPGFVLGEVQTVPTHYTVQGPESRVQALEFVSTRPISVEGAAGPVEAVAQPLLPDPLLRALGVGEIQITIDITPELPPEEEDAVSE
jgi:hypothetical protein